MAESTKDGITYPVASDYIKESTDPAKLATHLKLLATTANTAIDGARFYRGYTVISGTTDLFALEAGYEYGVSSVVTARALGLPRERPGWIRVLQIGNGKLLVYRSSEEGNQPSLEFTKQRTIGGVIQEWEPLVSSTDAGQADGPVRRELLQQGLTARKGGRIGTGGKGVIALRFDDAPADFVTKILPLLQERNLPFTRVSTSDSIASTGEIVTDAKLTEMQDYCIQSGGEVWNHGRDHADAGGVAAIYDNLIGSLHKLREKMPRIPIDCFSPPGGSVSYDGFMPAYEINNWSDFYGGRLLMGHHALVSGYFGDTFYRPIDGQLRDGQNHYGNDSRSVANTKGLIDKARDWKVGVSLMWHAHNLDKTGQMSTADLAEVLDYLVAQRDAGNILVLTLSGLGVADRSSDQRDDLLTVHAGATISESITYPQYRQGTLGSTRELLATVTGTSGQTVTSVIGESTKTHTIPAGGTLQLRHVATIPTDITSLTVSIDAETTGARLLPV